MSGMPNNQEIKETTASVIMRLARHIMDHFPYEPNETAYVLRRLENAGQDKLGLGTITYWPDIGAENAASEQ